MVVTSGGAKENETLRNRVDDFGVQLRDLVRVDENSQHKFTIEMNEKNATLDLVFKEVMKNVQSNVNATNKTSQ
jgi:hypothetical protein